MRVCSQYVLIDNVGSKTEDPRVYQVLEHNEDESGWDFAMRIREAGAGGGACSCWVKDSFVREEVC